MELKKPNTRQDLIIRQSCLKSAVEYYNNVETKKDILTIAEEFEKWIKR